MKKMLLVSLMALSFTAMAESKIIVKDARIKETPPGMKTTAAFVHIENHTDGDIELISADGDFAKSFELHDMDMKNGKMAMRRIPSIPVKKHETKELASGGLHIMIFDVKKPMKKNDKYNLKLNFSNKESVTVEATVI